MRTGGSQRKVGFGHFGQTCLTSWPESCDSPGVARLECRDATDAPDGGVVGGIVRWVSSIGITYERFGFLDKTVHIHRSTLSGGAHRRNTPDGRGGVGSQCPGHDYWYANSGHKHRCGRRTDSRRIPRGAHSGSRFIARGRGTNHHAG